MERKNNKLKFYHLDQKLDKLFPKKSHQSLQKIAFWQVKVKNKLIKACKIKTKGKKQAVNTLKERLLWLDKYLKHWQS